MVVVAIQVLPPTSPRPLSPPVGHLEAQEAGLPLEQAAAAAADGEESGEVAAAGAHLAGAR